MQVWFTCPIDGVRFSLPRSHAYRVNEPTCSQHCGAILRKRKMGHISVIVICNFCGDPFQCPASIAARAKQHFCCDAHKYANHAHYVQPLEERFWKKVNKNTCLGEGCGCHKELGHCWPWTGGVDAQGYAKFNYKGKIMKASRMAYALTEQIDPMTMDPKIFRCHKCDQPICIRPEHTFNGTNQDNINDAVKKGRKRRIRRAIVIEIRRLQGTMTPNDIAEQFHLTEKTVHHIYNLEIYKNYH